MKITKSRLRQIIKEEIQKSYRMTESDFFVPGKGDPVADVWWKQAGERVIVEEIPQSVYRRIYRSRYVHYRDRTFEQVPYTDFENSTIMSQVKDAMKTTVLRASFSKKAHEKINAAMKKARGPQGQPELWMDLKDDNLGKWQIVDRQGAEKSLDDGLTNNVELHAAFKAQSGPPALVVFGNTVDSFYVQGANKMEPHDKQWFVISLPLKK